jgi:type I restriction enzyme S subunit
MKGDWRETTLGDEVDLLTGFPFKSERYTNSPDGIPLVRGDNIVQGTMRWDGVKRWPVSESEEHGLFQLHEGDVVLAMDRPWIEAGLKYAAISKHDLPCLLVQRTARLRGRAHLDTGFLRYLIGSLEFTQHIHSITTGTAVPHISGRHIKDFTFALPPLPEQRAIASILGALDDKIELNRRMNATLEAMARALFQSWFVDFDPVHAKSEGRQPEGMDADTAALFPAEFEESELGMIPKGWEVKSLPEAIEVNPRRILKSGTIAPYLDMKNLPTQGHSAEDVVDRQFSSGTKFQNGDTLLARITPCLENGKTGFVDFLEDGQIGWGSTEYIVFSPKVPFPPQFGYFLARSDALRSHAIQNMTGTSGRQRVPSECFNTFLLTVPPFNIAECFAKITTPLMAKIKTNTDQSRTLAVLRDTLLPRLLSGELSVRAAQLFGDPH